MVLLAANSPLVASSIPGGDMETRKIKAIRGFKFDKKVIRPEEVIQVPLLFALEIQASNKAVIIEETVAPPKKKDEEKDPKKGGGKKDVK